MPTRRNKPFSPHLLSFVDAIDALLLAKPKRKKTMAKKKG